MIISVPSSFMSLTPSFLISSRMSLVEGSMCGGITNVPLMINWASALSKRYLNWSPRRVFMIGALCARENLTLHSLWMVFSISSWSSYSFTSLSTVLCTLRTLLLCVFFTVHYIRHHILLLSSLLHFCLIAATLICVVSSPLCVQGSPRDVLFWGPLPVLVDLFFVFLQIKAHLVAPPLWVIPVYLCFATVQIAKCT